MAGFFDLLDTLQRQSSPHLQARDRWKGWKRRQRESEREPRKYIGSLDGWAKTVEPDSGDMAYAACRAAALDETPWAGLLIDALVTSQLQRMHYTTWRAARIMVDVGAMERDEGGDRD